VEDGGGWGDMEVGFVIDGCNMYEEIAEDGEMLYHSRSQSSLFTYGVSRI
jgi:hypothetical protein